METSVMSKHELLAQQMIEMMKKGTAPWQIPWETPQLLPYNATTNNRYNGCNVFTLMATAAEREYNDPRWLTFNQARELGEDVRVKKGEHGTPIVYIVTQERQEVKDEEGKPMLDEKGKPIKEMVKLERPKAMWSYVFNAEQIDNMPALEIKQYEWDPIDRAEEMLQSSGVRLEHTNRGKSAYYPNDDHIELPEKTAFPSALEYYQTALHEVAHSTGHESRLNRDLKNPFGTPAYAKEELVAELASVLLAGEVGFGFEPRPENAAYVQNWISLLEDDPKILFEAASAADKATKYVVAQMLEHQQVQEQVQEQNQNIEN
jgi:antirestriction protein ArdC